MVAVVVNESLMIVCGSAEAPDAVDVLQCRQVCVGDILG